MQCICSCIILVFNFRNNQLFVLISLSVRHIFANKNFESRARSYLQPCGHPWAALVLFDSCLIASMYDISSVSLGFEKSADEGNGIVMNGIEVNHQYDKSSVFLKLASEFIYANLNLSLSVYSPLSEMWELEIARIFCLSAELRKLHPFFISCNEPIQQGSRWCNKCEKCAFVYLLMSAWLPPVQVIAIFEENLFEKLGPQMELIFLSLIGHKGTVKPFECVGTFCYYINIIIHWGHTMT